MSKYLFLIFCLWFTPTSGSALSIQDSLKIVELDKKVVELVKSNKTLEKEVKGLQEDKRWLQIMGIGVGTTSLAALLYMLYLSMSGLRKKAIEVVNEIATQKIKEEISENKEQTSKIVNETINNHPFLKDITDGDRIRKQTSEIVNNLISNHPFFKEINDKNTEINKVKNKPILIVSHELQNQNFHNFLKNKGFEQLNSRKIDKIENLDPNDYDLVFFNNENGQLTQAQMDIFLKEYTTSFNYFYFNTTYQRWESEENIKVSGFANSRETLENRLVEALKK